jgi:hypothetical protein
VGRDGIQQSRLRIQVVAVVEARHQLRESLRRGRGAEQHVSHRPSQGSIAAADTDNDDAGTRDSADQRGQCALVPRIEQ